MDEAQTPSNVMLRVTGPYSSEKASEPIPENLPVSSVETEVSRGLDGQAVEHLALSVNWGVLAADVVIHLLSHWLYDRFKRRPSGQESTRDAPSRITIEIHGNVIVVDLTDQEVVKQALEGIFGATRGSKGDAQ